MRIETKFSIGDKVLATYFIGMGKPQIGCVSGISIEVDRYGHPTIKYHVTIPYDFNGVKHECITSSFEAELKAAEDENNNQVQPK